MVWWGVSHFGVTKIEFGQMAKTTQARLRKNIPLFITAEDLPSGSPHWIKNCKKEL